MKKWNIWLLMSLFVAAFTLSACGDDDDEPKAAENELVGKWESALYDATTYALELTANNNVVFDYRMYSGETGELHAGYQKKGTYSVKDHEITVVFTQHTYLDIETGSYGRTDTSTGETYKYTYRFQDGKLLISGHDDTNGAELSDRVFVKK